MSFAVRKSKHKNESTKDRKEALILSGVSIHNLFLTSCSCFLKVKTIQKYIKLQFYFHFLYYSVAALSHNELQFI